MIENELYVVDIIREVVQKVSEAKTAYLKTIHPIITGVHYLSGHHTEINRKLQSLSNSKSKIDKYPLIALFQDFKNVYGQSGGYAFYAPLQIMALYYTDKERYNEERYTKVIKPLLKPILKEFEYQLYAHKNIVFEYPGKRTIEIIDRPHWGAPAKYGNDGYILNDVLDGIELFIPKLTFKNTNLCDGVKLSNKLYHVT